MKVILYTLASLVMAACATSKPSCTAKQAMSTDSTQTFAFSLFSAVNSTAEDVENFCISPASAQWALAMTANGARGNTAKQMYEALGYPDAASNTQGFNCLQKDNIKALNNSSEAKVSVANSIWVNKEIKLKSRFIEENAKFYDATTRNVTFDAGTVKEINDWCSDKTEGKINSILNEANPATKLLLINALHFKAEWNKPFYKDITHNNTFTKANGEKITVPMMARSQIANYYEDSTIQATEKSFKNGEYSMLLILPRDGVSIQQAIGHITEKYKKGLFGNSKKYNVHLTMPRFRTEFGTSLKPMLKAMGINEAFTAKADFSEISKTPLLIDDVIQKSYISVNEDGAEAAAVTAVQMMLTGLPREEPKTLTLDRPFIYAITNNHTSEILFIGKVSNPQY